MDPKLNTGDPAEIGDGYNVAANVQFQGHILHFAVNTFVGHKEDTMASASMVLRLAFSSGVALFLGSMLLVLGFHTAGTETKDLPVRLVDPPERNEVSVQLAIEEIFGLPSFETITDPQQRKVKFLAFLGPVVRSENARILAQRQRLVHLWQLHRLQVRIDANDTCWLAEICREYRVDLMPEATPQFWLELLGRVDMVPVSLALAQAANESGWGTSRFAREGNNLFGQWYFAREGGIIPQERRADQNHKLAQFDTVNAAVRSYLRNLNTGNAYESFRRLRTDCRDQGRLPDALVLAGGLTRYSEQGQAYVDLIRLMIRNNQSLLELESSL